MEIIGINSQTRLIVSFFFLLIFISLEFISPLRKRKFRRLERWPSNIFLGIFNACIVKLLIQVFILQFTFISVDTSSGLLNMINLNSTLRIILEFLFLDLLIYLQHRVFHKIDFFWRFHKVHHTDLELDVSSGNRFHTIEIIFSMIYKIVIIYLLGVSPIGFFIFEIILNTSSMFNHSNIKVPQKIEGFLSKIIITPNLHLIHHSVIKSEMNSNFGFCLSIWDQLFKSSMQKTNLEIIKIDTGVEKLLNKNELKLINILTRPFK